MKGPPLRAAALARACLGIALALALPGATPPAAAQRATERYIPIGRSPGASGKLTLIGTIQAVDPSARRFTLVAPSGSRTVVIAPETHVWLDRSKQRRTNLDGGFADLWPGRRVEVRFRDPAQGLAGWVKVEVATPERP